MLSIRGLSKHFGGVAALTDVTFDVPAGSVCGLIGPNGSGKTTLFNCVTGFMRPDPESAIEFEGQDITGLRADVIARLGIVRTFQEVRVFGRLSVLNGLLMSLQQHQEDDLWRRFLGRPLRALEAQGVERARLLLALVGLPPSVEQMPINSLSYGQRKLYTLAAALMPDSPLVLLDEPTAAVNPVLIDSIKQHIVELNGTGKTFLVVEHNMDVVMDICDPVIVLDHGQKIAAGPPAQIRGDNRVIDAYFGV